MREKIFEGGWLSFLQTVPVPHCHHSFALIFTLSLLITSTKKEGNQKRQRKEFKVVYSGDTRPCLHLARVGLGADLLVHEATFESELKEDALRKMHSTVGVRYYILLNFILCIFLLVKKLLIYNFY